MRKRKYSRSTVDNGTPGLSTISGDQLLMTNACLLGSMVPYGYPTNHARFPVYSDPLVASAYGRQPSIPPQPRKHLLVYTQGRLMAESPRFYLFFNDPRIFKFDRTKICITIFCLSVLDFSGLFSTQRFYSQI